MVRTRDKISIGEFYACLNRFETAFIISYDEEPSLWYKAPFMIQTDKKTFCNFIPRSATKM